MIKLLENLLRVNEDATGLRALHRVYIEYELRLDPDPADLFDALTMMEKYYTEYLDLDLYAKYGGKDLPVHQDYQTRLEEIRKALKSTDTKKQMIALDNAVNQWHIDFPVIMHLLMEVEEDPELLDMVEEINDILSTLGRLPEESPYKIEDFRY